MNVVRLPTAPLQPRSNTMTQYVHKKSKARKKVEKTAAAGKENKLCNLPRGKMEWRKKSTNSMCIETQQRKKENLH